MSTSHLASLLNTMGIVVLLSLPLRGLAFLLRKTFRHRPGKNPLHCAAKEGRIDDVKQLLCDGADVKATTPVYGRLYGRRGAFGNYTALHVAAQNGHVEIVEVLLEYGAEVDARCYRGDTPMCYAAAKGHLQIVEILLQHDANVNGADAIDADVETPMSGAAQNGHLEIVEVLLEHGADRNQAMCTAAAEGHLDIVQILLRDGVVGLDIDRALALAVRDGHRHVVECLVSRGADVNTVYADRRGSRPLLHVALSSCMDDQYDMVKLLLSNDADINQVDSDGNTPLHVACCRTGGIKNIRLLLDCPNLDLQAVNERGMTAVDALIDGSDFDSKDIEIDDYDDYDEDGDEEEDEYDQRYHQRKLQDVMTVFEKMIERGCPYQWRGSMAACAVQGMYTAKQELRATREELQQYKDMPRIMKEAIVDLASCVKTQMDNN